MLRYSNIKSIHTRQDCTSATTLNKPHYISIAIFTTAIATYLGL